LFCRLNAEPGAQRHGDRRQLRGRIGVRQISSDGAAVSDLRMRDVRQRFADQRKRQRKRCVALQGPVARQRANPCRSAG